MYVIEVSRNNLNPLFDSTRILQRFVKESWVEVRLPNSQTGDVIVNMSTRISPICTSSTAARLRGSDRGGGSPPRPARRWRVRSLRSSGPWRRSWSTGRSRQLSTSRGQSVCISLSLTNPFLHWHPVLQFCGFICVKLRFVSEKKTQQQRALHSLYCFYDLCCQTLSSWVQENNQRDRFPPALRPWNQSWKHNHTFT